MVSAPDLVFVPRSYTIIVILLPFRQGLEMPDLQGFPPRVQGSRHQQGAFQLRWKPNCVGANGQSMPNGRDAKHDVSN